MRCTPVPHPPVIAGPVRRHRPRPGTVAALTGLAVVFALLAQPATAAGPRSNRSLGSGRLGPETSDIQGWGNKTQPGAGASVGTQAATAVNLNARVAATLGYDPFVLRTAAGSAPVARGLQSSLGTRFGTAGTSDPVVCTVMMSVPGQPAVANHLAGYGCDVLRPLSVNTYAVRATPATLAALANDPLVYWVGQMPWELKIDPALAGGVGLSGVPRTAAAETDPDRAVVGLYHADDATTVANAVRAAGGSVAYVQMGGDALVCDGLDANGAAAVAQLPEVCYLDAYRIPRVQIDTSMQFMGHHDTVRSNAVTRYGRNIPLAMIDSGLQRDHTAFGMHGTLPAMLASGSNVAPGNVDITKDNPSGHGTYVASIILSRWFPGNLLGATPWTAGTGPAQFRYIRAGADAPEDPTLVFNADLAIQQLWIENSALVINNSWGSNIPTGTDQTSIIVDNATWNARQAWVFAAGNSGTAPGSIGSPAAAKNAIAVGSVGNTATITLSNFSSEGPTTDGRKKPDIYAPGETITAADFNDPRGVVDVDGTSFSAPHVTGFLGTLLDHFPQVQRRPSLAKAIMMASATKNAALQPHTGLLNSFQTHFTTNTSALFSGFVNVDVGPGTAGTTWDLNGVPPGLQALVAVLTWVEPPATLGAAQSVLNDIDLLIDTNRDGFVDFSSTTSFDNVETVLIPTPPAGNYRFVANRFTAVTNYNPALAVFAFMDPTTTPAIHWTAPPPPSAQGRQLLPMSWEVKNFAGTISQHQVHLGDTGLLASSSLQANANGVHTLTPQFAAPNIGGFDSPSTFQFVVRAFDDATQVLSPLAGIDVEAGPMPPVVDWVLAPPASVPSGGSFVVQWQLRDFVSPVTTNAVGWGVTSLLAQTTDQPGGNAIYTATVNAPVIGSSATLLYTAFAMNAIEFAFAPLTPVLITVP